MNYKGYTGKVEFDEEAKLFYGRVLGINDGIDFQGKSVKELEKAFKGSIDDYLEFCEERGEEPDKPYSGKFVVRTSPEVHRALAIAAEKEGKSLNEWIESVTREAADHHVNG